MSNAHCNAIPELILFAGPTLTGLEHTAVSLPEKTTVLPPIQRGEIPAALHGKEPGVVVIVDGLFHQSLAVGHREIRDTLALGWTVWGLSSMGAIRAYEMRTLGVQGFGSVYARFLREEDFQDDEVALLHGADPPYRAFSEPLIHLRTALEMWRSEGVIAAKSEDSITATLKSLWYGERTMELFAQLTREHVAAKYQERVEKDLDDFDRFRVKSLDLREFLRVRPWASGR